MTTHTPTPWTFYRDEDNHIVCVVNDAAKLSDRRQIAQPGKFMSRSFDENQANMAFIVRACNVHEELVEAAQKAVEALKDATFKLNGHQECPMFDGPREAFEAALAKAKGK